MRKELTRRTKKEMYEEVCLQMEGLLQGVPYDMANLANASALLYQSLPEINWVGFYLLQEDKLVLGPFQGKPACVEIAIGKGVCGTAVLRNETVLVKNVHEFPGHIACDSASNSEIVLPIHKNGELVGVLDIDSPFVGRFDEEDKAGLELMVQVLERMVYQKVTS